MGGPGGATVWTGSARSDCASDERVLLHRHFTEPNGTTRSCVNGAATAQSINVHNNLKVYTSRLNITVTNNVAGATIMCIYDSMGDPNTANITIQLSTKLPCKHVYTVTLVRNFHWCKISYSCHLGFQKISCHLNTIRCIIIGDTIFWNMRESSQKLIFMVLKASQYMRM